MSIWKNPSTLTELNQFCTSENMLGTLGIQFTAIHENSLEATMPVDARTKQPLGLLHGGASCVLAETLGSVASGLVVGWGERAVMGTEISATHLRSARQGRVIGVVKPIRLGGTIHVWDIQIRDENSELVCVSRLSVMIRDLQAGSKAPRA